jgi:UDP-GlcNAc:undecaprenyl-phosphate GlcNAc-1-phosphate transferase
MSYILLYIVIPFLCSVGGSAGATWLVREFAQRIGILDKPGAHKQHEKPTPTLGGIAVFLAFLVGVYVSGPVGPRLAAVVKASGLLVAVGVLDDLRGVNANIKLLSLAIASWMLWSSGVHLDLLGGTGIVACLVTFLWLGLVASAFNGVDNADGSAAGLAVISSLFTFLISWSTWQHDLAVLSLVLAGAAVGFLMFNFPAPKASIFLGDSGSLFLGFGLSTLTVLGQWSAEPWKAAVIALLLVIAPLFDFVFILTVRGLEGRYKSWDDPIKMCARDHLFHRLRAIGLSGRQGLLVLYSLGFLGGSLALNCVLHPEKLTLVVVGRLLLFLCVLALGLKRVRLPAGSYTETH